MVKAAMAESIIHTALVKQLKEYIVKEYLEGDDGSVLIDSAGVERNDRDARWIGELSGDG